MGKFTQVILEVNVKEVKEISIWPIFFLKLFEQITISLYSRAQGFWAAEEKSYLFSGSWGHWLLFRGAIEQAHSLVDLGSPATE